MLNIGPSGGTEMDKKIYRLQLTTEMLGTVAMDPKIYSDYIESKKPKSQEEDESLTVEKMEEKGWTGFHKDNIGLFIYEYMVKGFLKAAGNVLRETVKIKQLRSKLDDYAFVAPRRIYLGKMVPDGVLERPIRMTTPKGPRVALAKSDYVNAGTVIEVEVTLVPHAELKMAVIDRLFEHGQLMGLGQFRNGGYGRFIVLP
jgi:hypothetical protein